MAIRLLERCGRAIAIRPIATQGCLMAEPGRGADFGAAAVVRAVGGDLGDYRLVGYRRAVVTCGRTVSDGWVNSY